MIPKVGDIVAFSGNDLISRIIKLTTWSNVSHVGAIVEDNKIIESTITRSQIGVKINNLSDRITEYNGNIWRLYLTNYHKDKINKFIETLLSYQGVLYDPTQAIEAGLLKYIPILKQKIHRDTTRLFCSELIATGMVKAGIIDSSINPSLITPKDLCAMNIYLGSERLKGIGQPVPFNRKHK